MRFRVVSIVLTILVISAAVSAQQIGNYVLAPNSSTANIPKPYTIIDINSPATSSGTIGAVSIRANQPCAPGFKVKFFHVSGGVYTPYADRGPFDITQNLMVVQLTPPVTVTAGDVIGLVALQDCSGLVGQVPILFEGAAQFSGEVTTPVVISSAQAILLDFAVAAFGAQNLNSDVRTQVIPAAGAAEGAFGASFKTDLFLSNPRSVRSAGRLVYHPEQTSGQSTDAAFPFIVDSHRSLTYPNFVKEKIGVTGKGSIDVYTTIGYEPPTVAARVYDDAATGTKGFTFDALTEREALQLFEFATLAVPSDASKFRINIGVRSLSAETQVEFQLYDSNGGNRTALTNTYAPDFYTQTDFRSLFGVDFQPGDTITVIIRRGAAFVYSSNVDNGSNDPSLQLAKQLK